MHMHAFFGQQLSPGLQGVLYFPPNKKITPKERGCKEHSVGTQLVPSQGGTWVTTTQLVALVVSFQRIRCQCLRLAMDTSATAPGKMMLAYLHFVFYECKGS